MLLDEERKFAGLDKNLVFLVVDDLETMRRVTVNQLRMLGAEKVLTAKDGMEAMRILHSQVVHVILSDWNMPVMDGLAFLQEVRKDPKLFTLPFVMITAEAERHRVEKAIAGGVTSLLLKPYSANQLRMRLESAFSWRPRKAAEVVEVVVAVSATGAEATPQQHKAGTSTPSEPLELPTPKERDRPTLLLVDDTPDNLLLLSQLFKDEYRVRLAQNGEKALAIATSDNPPDLVLLDVMMPGIDGFEVARRMREHPNSEAIPVIFVTAMTGEDARMAGLDLGAVDYVTKPIQPELLKPRVRNFMRYVQMRKNLQADYDQMIEAAQLRQDVEHITRHDMKGPLAGVLGIIQMMLTDDGLGKRHLEQLHMVEEAALQVMNMINLSSELYRIEAGRFELHAKPVPVAEILRKVGEIDRLTFASKGVKIAMELEPECIAMGDTMLCYSVFQNLLKNAFEAAPAGSTINVRLSDEHPLKISFSNQGAVPEAIRERFFDKYVTHGKEGGTGLGTYSARLLTQAQKGDIALQVEGDTTTVTVTLPRAG
jgi:hypothetical protein